MTTTPTIDPLAAELDALRARLIARRVNGGGNPTESAALLAELESTLAPQNLASGLAYNGFATTRGADAMAMSLTRYVAAVSLGELGR